MHPPSLFASSFFREYQNQRKENEVPREKKRCLTFDVELLNSPTHRENERNALRNALSSFTKTCLLLSLYIFSFRNDALPSFNFVACCVVLPCCFLPAFLLLLPSPTYPRSFLFISLQRFKSFFSFFFQPERTITPHDDGDGEGEEKFHISQRWESGLSSYSPVFSSSGLLLVILQFLRLFNIVSS